MVLDWEVAAGVPEAISVYRLCVADDCLDLKEVTVLRDGMEPSQISSDDVRNCMRDGRMVVRAGTHQGPAAVADEYVLLKRHNDPLVYGACAADLIEIDRGPGPFYVTLEAKNAETDLLFGPCSGHIEALCMVQAAKRYLADNSGLERTAKVAACRVDSAEHGDTQLQKGRLNAVLAQQPAVDHVDGGLLAESHPEPMAP